MTKQELLDKLAECDLMDTETGHEEADDALLKFINDADVSAAFLKMARWYA